MRSSLCERVIVETYSHYAGSISGITLTYKVIIQDDYGKVVSESSFCDIDDLKEYLAARVWIDF